MDKNKRIMKLLELHCIYPDQYAGHMDLYEKLCEIANHVDEEEPVPVDQDELVCAKCGCTIRTAEAAIPFHAYKLCQYCFNDVANAVFGGWDEN